MKEYRPKARKAQLLLQELGDEIVVYDLERNHGHCLNGSAARVWTLCNGERTVSQIAALIAADLQPEEAESLVWHALDQFTKQHLLEGPIQADETLVVTRRRAILRLGLVGTLIPLVDSIVSPPAAWAQSGGTGPTGVTA